MKLVKNLITVAMMLSIAGFAAADDWDDMGGESSAAEPSISASGSAEFTGRVYTDQIREFEKEDTKDLPTESRYSAKVNLDYSGPSSDVSFKFKFDNNSLGEYKEDILDEFTARAYLGNLQIEAGKMKVVWGKGDKIHVVDNFNANDYTDFVYPDYIDRRIGEPMLHLVYSTPSDIKFEAVATPMMTADRLATSGIWQPAASKTLTDTVTAAMKHNLGLTLNDAIATGDSTDAIDAIMDASSFSSDNLVSDNIHSLKYGQAGARTTFTLGGIDFGASYYYGHYKQPTANLSGYVTSVKSAVTNAFTAYAVSTEGQTALGTKYYTEISNLVTTQYGPYYTSKIGTDVSDPATGATVTVADTTVAGQLAQKAAYLTAVKNHGEEEAQAMYANDELKLTDAFDLPSLTYDRLQVFGLEAAFVLWKFNIRGEGAYYLTEDTAGDNPWIKNNSVQWVAGFDMDMPWTNMNLNVQTQGKYILNNDKIESEYDTDYNSDDKYISNKVIVAITDSYAHDSVKVELKGIYEVETKDFVVMPSLTIKAVDEFTITTSGMWIKTDNENSEFYNFRRNSFGQISCKYLF